MFTHILLPTDGSELSNAAIQKGIQLAKSIGAKVTGLHVIRPFTTPDVVALVFGDSEEHYFKVAQQQAEDYLAVIGRAAKEAGVHCETEFVTGNHPYEAIIWAAEEHGCDLIAMASHGRSGIQSMLIGSETAKVLTHTKLPVLVFH